MTALRLFLPRDAAAVALGADLVARALEEAAKARGVALDLVRTGTRGMVWLEPLLEAESGGRRVGFGPLAPGDAPAVLAAIMDGGGHAKAVGPVEAIGFFAGQTRLVFARAGVTDPVSPADYRAHGGWAGLVKARSLGAAATVEEVIASGLRGRGGAGFPTGIKWRTAAAAEGSPKYLVCNADEGDSGTFSDRMLMEGDPFLLIEGMAIAAFAVGASQGYIYIRSEYPHAIAAMREAIRTAEREGVLEGFTLAVRVGAGAYICGEETSLLDSLEGKRGQVRAKPPLPAISGLWGKPTVINNVISLASVPWIIAEGAAAYRDFGMGRSRGTIPVQLAGNVRFGGLYECAFGVTLGDLVERIGGGTASGRPARAAQVGGPLGAYFPPALFDTPFDYEAFAARDGLIGHGGVVVFDDSVDMAQQARFAMEFCGIESCGKCTPCRIGAPRGVEVIDRLVAGVRPDEQKALLTDLCNTMKLGSLCALGGLTPYPVMSALTHFPEDFVPRAGARLAAE